MILYSMLKEPQTDLWSVVHRERKLLCYSMAKESTFLNRELELLKFSVIYGTVTGSAPKGAIHSFIHPFIHSFLAIVKIINSAFNGVSFFVLMAVLMTPLLLLMWLWCGSDVAHRICLSVKSHFGFSLDDLFSKRLKVIFWRPGQRDDFDQWSI